MQGGAINARLKATHPGWGHKGQDKVHSPKKAMLNQQATQQQRTTDWSAKGFGMLKL